MNIELNDQEKELLVTLLDYHIENLGEDLDNSGTPRLSDDLAEAESLRQKLRA